MMIRVLALIVTRNQRVVFYGDGRASSSTTCDETIDIRLSSRNSTR